MTKGDDIDVLALEEALTELATRDARQAQVVELRRRLDEDDGRDEGATP